LSLGRTKFSDVMHQRNPSVRFSLRQGRSTQLAHFPIYCAKNAIARSRRGD